MSLDQVTDVMWSATPPYAVADRPNGVFASKPLCLDENKFLLTRECNGSEWTPAAVPTCAFVQEPYDQQQTCMPGYIKPTVKSGADICFKIEAPGPWHTTCPAGYTALYHDLFHEVQEWILKMVNNQNISTVWMPARRYETNGPILWTAPGERYGENVGRLMTLYYSHKGVYENDCLVAHHKDNFMKIDVDDCEKTYPLLCIYRESQALTQLACPDEFYTTAYKGHQDYCYSGHPTLNSTNSTPLVTPPLIGGFRTTQQHAGLRFHAPTPVRNRSSTSFPTPYRPSVLLNGGNESALAALEAFKKRQKESYNWINDECDGEVYLMNSPEKTTIFRWLAKQLGLSRQVHCIFALFSKGIFIKGRDEWLAIANEVRYVNWDYPVEFGEYLTTNYDGRWNWVGRSFNCVLCQRKIEMQMPKMLLNFDEYKNRLFLTVYSEKYLWRLRGKDAGPTCFTNADYELVKRVKLNKVWTDDLAAEEIFGATDSPSISKSIYEVRLEGDGPGYYWCHGFAIPDFQMIEAPKIVAYRRTGGAVFAVMVDVRCYGKECTMVFDENNLRDMARNYRTHLRKYQRAKQRCDRCRTSVENVRIMYIEHIDPHRNPTNDVGTVSVLFHVSVDNDEFEPFDNEVGLSPDVLKVWVLNGVLEKILHDSNTSEYKYISMKSTEYCLPDTLTPVNGLKWSAARIGATIAPQELCLLHNGLPVLRRCDGDFIFGGKWVDVTRQQCHSNAVSKITQNLYMMDSTFSQSNETSGIVQDIVGMLSNSSSTAIVPADLFYLGRVMSTVYRLNSHKNITMLNKDESEHIFSIYNCIMCLNENTTRIAAALNSTNILLDAFDNIINGIPMNITSTAQVRNNLIVNAVDGTMVTETSKLIMYVIDPAVRRVSGIALMRNASKVQFDDDFTDYTVKLLFADQSPTALLEEEELEAAAFAPQELLERLDETRFARLEELQRDDAPPVRIVITMFYNDVLFKEYKNVTHARAGGKIISVSIPGYGPDLPGMLPIFVRADNVTKDEGAICGYWGFGPRSGWQNDGCEYGGSASGDNPVVLCACSHLTHFAYLVLGTYVHTMSNEDDNGIIKEKHHQALDMITLLGCSLSLVGIFGIAITALVFKTWRQKPSSKVLLQLSAAVGLQMVLLLFVNTEYSAMSLVMEERWLACVALGALLQYSILVAFTWMLITAYLQFMRYVKVLGQTRVSRFFLKSFLIGWGIPLIPVLLVVGIAPASYVHNIDVQNGGICYPSDTAFYLGIILPVGLIVLANLIIFLMVIYNILTGPGGKLRATERDLTLAQLRLSVLLFFLLGLSWIFGFLATTKAGLVFSYLFCLTATIQGFVLFVYFIILDPGTRKLWRNFFSKYFCCCCRDKIIEYK